MKKFILLLLLVNAAVAGKAQSIWDFSSRSYQPTGVDVSLTFVVPNGAPQQVLIRDLGPVLQKFGVPETLADPAMQLFRGNTLIASNDNWADSDVATLTAAMSSIGAFPLSPTSKDSVILATLDPGEYTVREYAADGGAGVGLHEIYAMDQQHGGFAAVSLKSWITSDGNNSKLIAGLISRNGSLMLQGRGPSLGAEGIADPILDLYSGNTALPGNNNWGTSPNAAAIAGYSNLLGLEPLYDKEAAVLVPRASGAYNAFLRMAPGGGSGFGEIGVYDLQAASSVAVPEPNTYAITAVLGAITLISLRRSRSRKG